jgi:hypothetical protein
MRARAFGNAMIVTRLALRGDNAAATRIFRGVFGVAACVEPRLPELFRFLPRFHSRAPVQRHGDDKINLQIREARRNIEVTASMSG